MSYSAPAELSIGIESFRGNVLRYTTHEGGETRWRAVDPTYTIADLKSTLFASECGLSEASTARTSSDISSTSSSARLCRLMFAGKDLEAQFPNARTLSECRLESYPTFQLAPMWSLTLHGGAPRAARSCPEVSSRACKSATPTKGEPRQRRQESSATSTVESESLPGSVADLDHFAASMDALGNRILRVFGL